MCDKECGQETPLDARLNGFTVANKVEADLWQHRSAGIKCATCMWYAEKKNFSLIPSKPIGRCRRHAPTMTGYPVVFPHDWCGDHKLDETK